MRFASYSLLSLPALLACAPHVVATRGNEVEVMVYTNRKLREDAYELVSTNAGAIARASPSRDQKALRFTLPTSPGMPEPSLYVRAAETRLVLPERGTPDPKVFTDPLWATWSTCRSALQERPPRPALVHASCPSGRGMEPLVGIADDLARRLANVEQIQAEVDSAYRRRQNLLRVIAREEEELGWSLTWLERSKNRHGAWTGQRCVAPIQVTPDPYAALCEPGLPTIALSYLYCGMLDASVNGAPGTGFSGCADLVSDLVLSPFPSSRSKDLAKVLTASASGPLCEAARDMLLESGSWLGVEIDKGSESDGSDVLQDLLDEACVTLSEAPGLAGALGLTCRGALFLKWAAWDLDPCVEQVEARCAERWEEYQEDLAIASDPEGARRACEARVATVKERQTSIQLLAAQLPEALGELNDATNRLHQAKGEAAQLSDMLEGTILRYNGGTMRWLPDATAQVHVNGLTLKEERQRAINKLGGNGDSWEGVGAGGGVGIIERPNLLLQGVPAEVGPIRGLDCGIHVTNAPFRMGVSLRAATLTRDDLDLSVLGPDALAPVDELELTHLSLSGWVDALPLSGASERLSPTIRVGIARSADTLSAKPADGGATLELTSELWTLNARAGLVLMGPGGRAQLRVTGEQVFSLRATATSTLTVDLDMTHVMER